MHRCEHRGAGKYSATMPDATFVLPETKLIARLMLEHEDRAEIKSIVHDGNLLNVKSIASEDKIFDYAFNRLSTISDDLKKILISGDDNDARYINLISHLTYDRLFREFVEEVYFERKQSHAPITDFDIMSFFERKGHEDEDVKNWKDSTLNRLRTRYSRILFAAGLTKSSMKSRETTTPYISSSTISKLIAEGLGDYVTITLGLL